MSKSWKKKKHIQFETSKESQIGKGLQTKSKVSLDSIYEVERSKTLNQDITLEESEEAEDNISYGRVTSGPGMVHTGNNLLTESVMTRKKKEFFPNIVEHGDHIRSVQAKTISKMQLALSNVYKGDNEV